MKLMRKSVYVFSEFMLTIFKLQISPLQVLQISCGQCPLLDANRWHCCIMQFCRVFQTEFFNIVGVFVNFPNTFMLIVSKIYVKKFSGPCDFDLFLC